MLYSKSTPNLAKKHNCDFYWYNNTVKKIEIITGIRNDGNLEVTEGLKKNDKIVAEGLKKTRPGGKIKPITN